MSMTLKIECSACFYSNKEIELDIVGPADLDPQKLKKEIEKCPDWVVEFNGDHMDTYCSKKCAE